MEIRAILARCTAHGAQFGGVPGGPPEMTPADIAHAVGRVKDPVGRDLVLMLWSDQAEIEPTVMRMLLVRMSSLFAARGWRVTKPGTMQGLIRAVLTEMRNPRHCVRCRGSGTRAGKPCPVCLGEGERAYTARQRARAAGMPWGTFQEWAGRYADIHGLIGDIESSAVRDIRKALR